MKYIGQTHVHDLGVSRRVGIVDRWRVPKRLEDGASLRELVTERVSSHAAHSEVLDNVVA
jgi:hypothetical protein